jgi:hypothetical protein
MPAAATALLLSHYRRPAEEFAMNERARPEAVGTSLENSPFFMPFSMNRAFKKAPRLLARAEGMYYYTPEGRKILDGTSGLWCVNAGTCRKPIVEAVQKAVATLDFAPPFQMGHPAAFEFAEKLAPLLPKGVTRIFFTNSGSESVDTALKLAIAYHRQRGEGQRIRLIGREKGYHGVNFGGTAVGGIVGNRKIFGALVTGRGPYAPYARSWQERLFARPAQARRELAEDLERLCQLHDPSTIAAVIVEPCLLGRRLRPPVGYLQKLREICDRHGILLIFDEVINAWGRLGKPFAAGLLRRHPGPHHDGKGHHQRHHSDGRGVHEGKPLPGLHDGPGERRRDAARLHLLGASGGLRGGPGHDEGLRGRRIADEGRRARPVLGGRRAFAEGLPERRRYPQHRADRGDRAFAAAWRGGPRAAWMRT